MPPLTFTISYLLGEPETGIWCPVCLLPSAARVPVFAEMGFATGRRTPCLFVFTLCPCGWRPGPDDR